MIAPMFLAIALSTAAGSGIVWSYQSNKYEQKIEDLRAEYSRSYIKALEVAHAETERLQTLKDEAEKKSQARQATLVAAVKSSRTALARLSNAADASISAAQESHIACLANASTFRVVFGQCSTRLVEVGRDAQGHLEDKRTLVDAWPK